MDTDRISQYFDHMIFAIESGDYDRMGFILGENGNLFGDFYILIVNSFLNNNRIPVNCFKIVNCALNCLVTAPGCIYIDCPGNG